MFTLPPSPWSKTTTSATTHFARCVNRAKTTARGFWAWLPDVRIGLPVVYVPATPPTESSDAGGNYCDAIVAAAARITR